MERRNYSYSSVNRSHNHGLQCLIYTIIVFNTIFAVIGAMMVAVGFWITLDTEFKKWVVDLGMEHFWVGVYILMAAGGLVMLQSFFGICGAFQRKHKMLVAFFICLVICFVLEVAGAAYMLANGMRYSNIEDWLRWRFYDLIDEFNHNEQAARIMNIIQEWVGCCGVDGSLDYIRWNKVIPYTCYNPITGNAWYKSGYGYVGCVRGFTMYLEVKAGWIAGLALFLAFFQIFCMIAACCLISIKRNYKEYRKSTDYLDRH